MDEQWSSGRLFMMTWWPTRAWPARSPWFGGPAEVVGAGPAQRLAPPVTGRRGHDVRRSTPD